MKNLIKKNQLMITALAIMIAIAGYLQFAGENLEEDYLTVNDGIASEADSQGVIAENYTADGTMEEVDLDGLLELSEEDLLSAQLTEIESLDSETDLITEDYLDTGMQVIDESAEVSAETVVTDQLAEATPEEGEIPGEAVFTSTNGVTVLSDAKLLK